MKAASSTTARTGSDSGVGTRSIAHETTKPTTTGCTTTPMPSTTHDPTSWTSFVI